MANEFETALKNAAAQMARYVKDAAEMKVETRAVSVNGSAPPNFDSAQPIARTIVRLDGDSETILPLVNSNSGSPEVDLTLFDLHQQNVNTAIEYRARILNALLGNLISPAK